MIMTQHIYQEQQVVLALVNRRTFTISTWLKRSSLGDDTIIGCGLSSDLLNINFAAGDELGLYNSNGGTFQTTRKFRDTSAWYHIVFAIEQHRLRHQIE